MRTSVLLPLALLSATLMLAGCSDDDSTTASSRESAEPTEAATDEEVADAAEDAAKDAAKSTEDAPAPDQFTDMKVVPGAGFGTVAVGATRAAVEEAFGAPSRVDRVPNELSGGTDTNLVYLDHWDEEQVIVRLDDQGRVSSLETYDASMKTEDEHVGIGSWKDEVTESFPETRCDDGGEGGVSICRLGPEQAGEVVTDFFVQDDQVRSIVIGRIVD